MQRYCLFDGIQHVEQIAVMLWYRNNESYIRDFMKPFFSRVEKLYPNVAFKYYIMENDSTDNTRKELQEFMATRDGVLIAEDMDLSYINIGTSYERIHRMALVRNHLLERVRKYLADCQWVLFLDSDVYIDEITIKQLLDKDPREHNICMLACNGVTVDIPSKETEHDVPVTFLHYYDTFAFVDKQDCLHHPYCASSQCISVKCNSEVPNRIDFSGNVEVRAAWGGCVLIDASAFAHPNVMWKTLGLSKSNALCEHVYLCDSISLCTGKKIVICGDIYAYYRTMH